MSLKIAELREEHLGAAAGCVSARYQALRREIPLLPDRYEQPDAILDLLRDLSGQADGVIAFQDGALVGFLLGLVIPEFMGKRSAYTPVWANVAATSHSRRIYEEMYARLAPHWLAQGCFNHVVSLMTGDRQALEAWHWLGFGLVNVDAVRPLTPLDSDLGPVHVRRAGLQDAVELSRLGRLLEGHEAATPTFWVHQLEDFGERLSWPGNAAWLALDGEHAVGFIALEPGEDCECALLSDPQTVNIAGAYTLEPARGQGVATSLLDCALAWARAQGYRRCSVDFESMNTLAARFWMRWFEPVSYSLVRSIDERARAIQSCGVS